MGFLGAYTTFSTFAQETWELTDDRHLLVASLYVAASVAVGVVAVALGHIVGRQLCQPRARHERALPRRS